MAEVSAFNKFAKMEDEAGTKQSKTEKLFNSHPDSKKRAKVIGDMAKKDGLYKEPVAVVAPVAEPTPTKKK